MNRAGVAIPGAILAARADINCVFHTHLPYTTAVSALECGLLPMSQAALRFQGMTAYHDYGRAASDPAECARLAKDMGDKSIMILRNHGGITTARPCAKRSSPPIISRRRVSFRSWRSLQAYR